MQIDGLRHAAVVDAVGSRLDRERWNEEQHHRPPHAAMPVDADSKAFLCRYTYDRNELKATGEEVVLEEYPPHEVGLYKLNPVYPYLGTAWFFQLYKVKNWFQSLLSDQLVPLQRGVRARRPARRRAGGHRPKRSPRRVHG